jgi:hypothetical protein
MVWRTSRPRLLSLQDTDVANLTLSNVDLRACRFAGAHHLDQLRLEATIDLAGRPAGVRVGWALPPLWRWTRRRTLAEEQAWRRTRAKRSGWYPPACRPDDVADVSVDFEGALQPAEIALLYRALRKGREDSKDEPGAADFYYGEMEMRRHDPATPWPERLVLALYWLVAGYGLRASRALATLTLVLVGAAWLLVYQHGFADPQVMNLWGTLRYLARTAIGLPFEPQPALTPRGEVLQIVVRVVAPVLLGLAALAIRVRIKR